MDHLNAKVDLNSTLNLLNFIIMLYVYATLCFSHFTSSSYCRHLLHSAHLSETFFSFCPPLCTFAFYLYRFTWFANFFQKNQLKMIPNALILKYTSCIRNDNFYQHKYSFLETWLSLLSVIGSSTVTQRSILFLPLFYYCILSL